MSEVKIVIYKKLLFLCLAMSVFNLAQGNGETEENYLDIFVISMWGDVRTYVLSLKLADEINSTHIAPIKAGLSKKFYDLQIYLPEVNNREVVELVCKNHSRIEREIFILSNGCKDEFCMESGRLGRICAIDKKWGSENNIHDSSEFE